MRHRGPDPGAAVHGCSDLRFNTLRGHTVDIRHPAGLTDGVLAGDVLDAPAVPEASATEGGLP